MDLALCGTDAMIAVHGSMIASQVLSSMGSNTWLSRPVWTGTLAQKSCSACTPDLFPTTPDRVISMATRGATRVDDDDDDDDDNGDVVGDDDFGPFVL